MKRLLFLFFGLFLFSTSELPAQIACCKTKVECKPKTCCPTTPTCCKAASIAIAQKEEGITKKKKVDRANLPLDATRQEVSERIADNRSLKVE